jgi:small subunit ribosomal protein S16
MAVKIRLFRRGRKKLALFDVVVADARSPRDGKFIEKIGVYNPNTNPATIELNETKAFDWIMKGAQPTNTVKAMLSYKGILFHKHLQIGVNKGALTQEEADKKLAAWKDSKTSKIEGKKDKLATAKAKAAKAKHEAEVKVSAAREEAIKNKNKVVEEVTPSEEAPVAAVEAIAKETAPVVAAEAAPEAPAAE